MRHFARPAWVVLVVAALVGYCAILIVVLAARWETGDETFRELNRAVLLAAGVFFVGTSLLLAAFVLVRRVARVVAWLSIGWMALTAVSLLALKPLLSMWAAVSAGVIIVALL
jgi:hypothetical protein